MTKTPSIPDFVQDADGRHHGLAEEYSVLTRLASPLLAEPRSARFDNFRHAVLLQCAIAWHHYNAVVLLLANGFVVPSLVLSRTLFELVVGTLYLLKNPNLLSDFLDHGKLVFYESARAAGLTQAELAPIKEECEKIRPRFLQGKRKLPWHRCGIAKLAGIVGLEQAYRAFYQIASGATHADATKTLSYGSRGWVQSLRPFADGKQAASVRYGSFMGVGTLLLQVNKALDMGHDEEAKAVLLLMDTRWKTLARPH